MRSPGSCLGKDCLLYGVGVASRWRVKRNQKPPLPPEFPTAGVDARLRLLCYIRVIALVKYVINVGSFCFNTYSLSDGKSRDLRLTKGPTMRQV